MVYRKPKPWYLRRRRNRYPRRYKKRTTRKFKSTRTMVTFPLGRTLFPPILKTRLRYVSQNLTLNPLLGSPATYIFRANSIHDPNSTGGGHQPRGFDELSVFYYHYVVLGSKCTVTFAIPPGYPGAYLYLHLNAENNVFSTGNDYVESRNTVYKVVNTTDNELSDAARTRSLTKTFSPRRFLGRNDPMSDPNLKGATASGSSNPAEMAYFHMGVAPILNSVDLPVITFTVHVEYIVAFIEPKTPNQS